VNDFETPFPGIRVRPLPKPGYDAATSLARAPSPTATPPSIPGLKPPRALEEIVYSERYPVVVKRARFRLWHKTVVRTGSGSLFRTSAMRFPRLMRAWGLWALAAAYAAGYGIAEHPGADPVAAAFWVDLLVWFGATSFLSGLVIDLFSKKRLVLTSKEGDLAYQILREAGGIASKSFVILDGAGHKHVRLVRDGTQLFKRRWRLYDRLGGEGPRIVEKSYLTALSRKMFGHLWGNFRARYRIWYNGITVGEIEREGFTNDRYRLTIWKDVPTLDPRLFAAAVAFMDHQDPERWHPWFN
jgi:hypothetical protein